MASVLKLVGIVILNDMVSSIDVPVAFEGYDLMFYWNYTVESGKAPWNGSQEYKYRILSSDSFGNEREYDLWFRNQENLDLFTKNPWYFMPQYGGFCAIGMCCQLMPDGYWNASISKLGPPSGIDDKNRGWLVYNEKLYFLANEVNLKVFSRNLDENIKMADEKWYSWFGSYAKDGGILNFQCYNDAITLLKCMEGGQDWAPLYNGTSL